MNKIIANAFAKLLTGFHVFFLIALSLGFVFFSVIDEKMHAEIGIFGELLGAALIVIFYIIFFGTISTLISINENLQNIDKRLALLTKQDEEILEQEKERLTPTL